MGKQFHHLTLVGRLTQHGVCVPRVGAARPQAKGHTHHVLNRVDQRQEARFCAQGQEPRLRAAPTHVHLCAHPPRGCECYRLGLLTRGWCAGGQWDGPPDCCPGCLLPRASLLHPRQARLLFHLRLCMDTQRGCLLPRPTFAQTLPGSVWSPIVISPPPAFHALPAAPRPRHTNPCCALPTHHCLLPPIPCSPPPRGRRPGPARTGPAALAAPAQPPPPQADPCLPRA